MARTSPIWKMASEDFKKLVSTCHNFLEVLKAFGMDRNDYRTLYRRLAEEKIDFSHLHQKRGSWSNKAIPLEEVLKENSTYNRCSLKKRLMRLGLLVNKCQVCGKEPWWNNKPLVMVLDHMNGINNDNRLPNLRLVCPDCNSQLPTFAGRRARKRFNNCKRCGLETPKGQPYCSRKCFFQSMTGKERMTSRKTERPPLKQLLAEVNISGYAAVGEKYGVTGNSIKKWIRHYGEIPPCKSSGRSKHPLYSMYRRLTKENEVCERWRDKFENFAEDMTMLGPRPRYAKIAKLNQEMPLGPDNCKWVFQGKRFSFFGEEMSISEAARRYGVCRTVISSRLLKGMTPEDSVAKEKAP